MAIKTIPLTYDEKDYEELKALKDASGSTWEGFVLRAARTHKNVLDSDEVMN